MSDEGRAYVSDDGRLYVCPTCNKVRACEPSARAPAECAACARAARAPDMTVRTLFDYTCDARRGDARRVRDALAQKLLVVRQDASAPAGAFDVLYRVFTCALEGQFHCALPCDDDVAAYLRRAIAGIHVLRHEVNWSQLAELS